MFSKPENGVSNIKLGEFNDTCTYLTDIPMECLTAFINAFELEVPASVIFNRDVDEFVLVSSLNGNTYIIENKKSVKLINIQKSFIEVANDIANDIENYLDEWVLWGYSTSVFSDDELKERKCTIEEKLKELKNLLGKIN